jgi:hypothetical protein
MTPPTNLLAAAAFFATAGTESILNQAFGQGFSWASLSGPTALAVAMGIGLRYMALQNVKSLKDMTDAKDKHIASLEADKVRLVDQCKYYENYIMRSKSVGSSDQPQVDR